MAHWKIRTLHEIVGVAEYARIRGRVVVTTNGCFDLLHVGHVRNLEFAKMKGSIANGVAREAILIVGLNSDASVRALKGETRPIIPEDERAEVLASLESVGYVFIFNGTPTDWIKKIRPDIHVKGAGVEQSPAFLPEKLEVEKYGGHVILAPFVEGKSTTNIIQKIVKTL